MNAIESGLNGATPESLGFRLSPEQAREVDDESRGQVLEEMKQAEIDTGIIQLESLLNAIVDKDFDKFEIYALRNILAVGREEDAELARWVRLDHYKNLDVEPSMNRVTPEELQLQRRKVHETAKLSAMLKAEEARNATVLAQLQSLCGGDGSADAQTGSPLAFLMSSQHASKPLSQEMQYAVAQLPALRLHLAQLKASHASAPSSRSARADDDSVQARRRGYVESQTRKVLERRGIDLDAVAGANQQGGRRMLKDEVDGLEAVVRILEGTR